MNSWGELCEAWPDPDRRDDALMRLDARIKVQPAGRDELSPREIQVLQALSHGVGQQGVAEILGIELETVKHHLRAARRILAAKDSAHAVAIALRRGLIT